MNTVVAIFTILSAIATAIYAFVAFKTLLEIRSQRETTYQPDIIIEEKNFYVYHYENEAGKFPVEFSYENKGQKYRTKRPVVNSFGINLYNIGLGTAKEIIVNYTIDVKSIEKIISILNEISSTLPDDKIYKIEKEAGKVTIYAPKESDSYMSSYRLSNEHETKINYLLPVNISQAPYELHIPLYILELYSISLYTFWLHGHAKFPEFPAIFINLRFKDIGNKIHKKEFILKIIDFAGTEHGFHSGFKIS
jgi:hypothetical protein